MLHEVKLRALVRGQWGAVAGGGVTAGGFPGGATLRADDGHTGWVLVEEHGERALGGALAWARQAGVDDVHLLVSDPVAAGVLARRAPAFATRPTVWRIEGTSLVPAWSGPYPDDPPLSDDAAAFVPLVEAAGAEPLVEHGVLLAEVLGLEVGRVVDGVLEVGVGKHDRETQALVHADRPTMETLGDAVARVRSVRNPEARPHQMNQLAAARWLRSVVCANPALIGVDAGAGLRPVSPPLLRGDLRVHHPAPAVGEGVIVVCTTGIDLDVVPTAADVRIRHGVAPDTRLVIVVPEPDAHPVVRGLAASLTHPAEVVTVPPEWRRLAGSL